MGFCERSPYPLGSANAFKGLRGNRHRRDLASSTFLQPQRCPPGKGHTFESCRVRQYYQVLSQFWRLSIIARVTVVSLPDFRASHARHGSLGDPNLIAQLLPNVT
jgi:hypothetical protein